MNQHAPHEVQSFWERLRKRLRIIMPFKRGGTVTPQPKSEFERGGGVLGWRRSDLGYTKVASAIDATIVNFERGYSRKDEE